jgi:choline dehydrogenase-like flavoprotein
MLTSSGKAPIPLTSVDLDVATSEQFDAIVVGAGAIGGYAAMLLTQAGLRTLVLDAGVGRSPARRPMTEALSFFTRRVATPEAFARLPARVSSLGTKAIRAAGLVRQHVQQACYSWVIDPASFIDDRDNPYSTEPGTDFVWVRARQPGGRLVVPDHGRQYYRLASSDFFPEDGKSPAWPFQQGYLDAWYAAAETHLELSGANDAGGPQPASVITRIRAETRAESELIALIKQRWPDAAAILGRYAPPPNGLHAAQATGRLALRGGAIVCKVNIDASGKTVGVTFVDDRSHRTCTAKAPLVFLCASPLETTRLLLLSSDDVNLGGPSDALGGNLMDHVVVNGNAEGGALPDGPVYLDAGQSVYLPRFDLRNGTTEQSSRGFGVQIYRSSRGTDRSFIQILTFGEMIPSPGNRVRLDPSLKDKWGIPALSIRCAFSDNELARVPQQMVAIRELAEVAGAMLNHVDSRPAKPGYAIHECGTARMGDSPDNSVVNPFNECWQAPGLFVTDASAFPSQGTQNPTLTGMALTGRAIDHVLRGRTAGSN